MSKATLNHKGYVGSCEVSFEDGCLHGQIMFIDDLITFEGTTPDELQQSFAAEVDRYLAYCAKTGKPANKPYSGSFNVRVGPELHRKAAMEAYRMNLGLNEYITKAVKESIERNGVTKIEHTHNHVVTVVNEVQSETRTATTIPPSSWEPMHAVTYQ